MDGETFFLLFNLFRFELIPHTLLVPGQACLRKLDSSVVIFLSNVKNSYNKRNKNSWKKKVYVLFLSIHLILWSKCICVFACLVMEICFSRFLTLHARFYWKYNNVLKVNTIVIRCTIYNVKMKVWIENRLKWFRNR